MIFVYMFYSWTIFHRIFASEKINRSYKLFLIYNNRIEFGLTNVTVM